MESSIYIFEGNLDPKSSISFLLKCRDYREANLLTFIGIEGVFNNVKLPYLFRQLPRLGLT